MSTASVTLIALIGWLSGLQALRVGHDRNPRPSRAELGTTIVLAVGAALLVSRQLAGEGVAPHADPTAVALVALLGWFVGLQTLRAGHDRSPRPSPAVVITTVALTGGAVALVVPHLYRMVT